MKNILYSALVFALLTVSFSSCVDDTDYDTPQINCEEPQIDASAITTIENVKQIWAAENPGYSDRNLVEFVDETANPIYVSGYVTSSDKTGNFYKEFFIQDDPTNPTHAIKIASNLRSSYTKYDIGRKVYVKLNGLAINISHGELIIGTKNSDNQIDEMSENETATHVLRNCDATDVTAITVDSPNAISNNMLGMYVKLDNMQFASNEIGTMFVDPNEDYDTHRSMISCVDGSMIRLETSSFSNFKTNILPSGKGSVKGILSRDYGDDFYVIRVNGIDAFSFDAARCDGVVLTPTMTLNDLISNYSGDLGLEENIIEAYVVSSDAAGNFYKNIYVQDAIENPTSGIQILVDEHDLFNRFPLSGKVYINTKGLYLGQSYGVTSLGYYDGSYVSQIDRGNIGNHLTYSGETATITPIAAELDQSGNVVYSGTEDSVPQGVLIQLNDMQVTKSGIGSAYTFYSGTASVNKSIFSCTSESSIIMRNSGYANFAHETFPIGNGTITAVLSGYFDTAQIYIRDTNDVNMDGERCGLECANSGTIGGSTVVYEDNFNSYAENSTNFGGWTNSNVNSGNNKFQVKSYGGAKYVQLGAYNSGEDPLEVWLVTPSINMDATTDEALSFTTKTGYNNGAALKLYASTDFSGDVNAATWTYIDAIFADGPSSGYGDITPSGLIDISCLDGDVYFAFRYQGGEEGITTTFQIDDVKITGN